MLILLINSFNVNGNHSRVYYTLILAKNKKVSKFSQQLTIWLEKRSKTLNRWMMNVEWNREKIDACISLTHNQDTNEFSYTHPRFYYSLIKKTKIYSKILSGVKIVCGWKSFSIFSIYSQWDNLIKSHEIECLQNTQSCIKIFYKDIQNIFITKNSIQEYKILSFSLSTLLLSQITNSP